MEDHLRKSLASGARKLSIDLSDEKIDFLLRYLLLLVKWNKAYNLTAVRDPSAMISKHLLDSLTVAEFIEGERFLDVGAGAGLPGIVLAIIFPNQTFDLLDSNGKKTRFLFQVKTELGLSNINIHHTRVEQLQTTNGYDGILSRAFATLADMAEGSEHLLADTGCFYAMKGVYPEDELKELSEKKKHYNVLACHPLSVPGEPGARHLMIIKPAVND